MAETIHSKISGDFLECTICLEPFKGPKVLPCLHTFCEGCLEKFVTQQGDVKNKFPCPTCRTDTILPEGGVAGLKNNFFVLSLSDTVMAHKSLVSKEDHKVQCDVCEEEVASRGCVPCEEFLCDECACAHHRAKRTRSHEVVGVAELREQLIAKTGSLKSQSLPACPKHQDEKLKFYCKTCQHPICRDCTVLHHKDHKYGYLADDVADVRAKIKDKLEAVKPKIADYQDKASAVAKEKAELDNKSKKAIDDIDAAANDEIEYLTGLVRRKQTELKENLAAITATRSKLLSATEDSVESVLGCLTSTADFAQKVAEHGSDFDVMNVYTDLTARLESLLKGPTPDIPDGISYVIFDPKTERNGKGVILGSIVDKETLEEKMEEEDMSRAEATFRFTVENFSKVKVEKLSPAVFISNLPWKICVKPWYSNNRKSLAVFLKSDANSKSLWSCHASGELRLIPQKNGVKAVGMTVDQTFYNKQSTWGRREFIPWHGVCDPQNGYIKDDQIVLEAHVKADAPCGEIVPGKNKAKEDEMPEEDGSQAEATLRFTVEDFSKFEERKLGPTVFICNLPWKIFAEPYYIPNTNNKRLAFFLQCDADSNSVWSCHASAELRLVPQKNGVQMFTKKTEHVFYSNETNWGFPEFAVWSKVCDPRNGFIKDDKIILEACVKADAPRGMKEITLGNIFSEEMRGGDNSRSKATFRFTVENVSSVMESQSSHPVFVCNLPWKISAGRYYIPNAHPPNNMSLSVFLKCDADSTSSWSCYASAELRLLPQKKGVETFKRNFRKQHVFSEKQPTWGYQEFMPWHEVCDPQKGYIKDDKIVLEAYVKAGAPRILA
ncbi:USP7 [Branchiostoma lanceolatum]|uniref:USP7 protein n=1 Tax=Branchiostoma lanceolatum TaxID=7740 RepID=A0A8K0A3B1_BRALA|nr:USP7 [Branchiostoma lanceolatum]